MGQRKQPCKGAVRAKYEAYVQLAREEKREPVSFEKFLELRVRWRKLMAFASRELAG